LDGFLVVKKVSIFLMFGVSCALANSDILELERSIEEATEIATVSKINIDYAPSVVSVLKSEKLRALGVTKVSDALALLPGVQIHLNQLGETVSIFRGFRNPNAYLSDKIKVMLDGVAINSETYGAAGFVMDLPINIVDRIEVLRGPGSTLYGSGAFYGAVNIVTKSASQIANCNEVFVAGGSWYYKKAGAIGCIDKNGITYSADGYYQGAQRRLTLDQSYTDSGGAFPRDYTNNESFDDFSAGFSIKKDSFSWTTRVKKSRQGNYYGMEERLEPREDTGHTNQFISSEVVYKTPVSSGTIEVKAGVRDYAYQINGIAREGAFVYTELNKPYAPATPTAYAEDVSYRIRVAEITSYAELLYKLKKTGRHSISTGVDISYTAIRENYFSANIEDYAFSSMNAVLLATQPAMQYSKNNEFLKKGINRTISSIYFEDLYELSANTDIAIGARLEKYSDLNAQISYRVGVVSRWFENSFITKLMYSLGHRAPTLAEKYARAHIGFREGDDFLKPEDIKSYEVMFIFKPSERHYFSLNSYYSELNNVIDIEEDWTTVAGHANYPKRLSRGVEAEYAYKYSGHHEAHINATINKTTYLNTSNGQLQDMPDVSPNMYKIWYIYRPMPDLTFGAKYMIFGKTIQNRGFSNKDTTVASNQILDMNINWKFAKDSEISLLLNNIQNREQKMPSYYYRNEPGRNGGMIREGRNFVIGLAHKF
jgi:outer membrane receptor protein involved in Fe transport